MTDLKTPQKESKGESVSLSLKFSADCNGIGLEF